MTPAVVSKIISMQPSFTMSENDIAQYVIHHAQEVVTSTITAIAKRTDTSEASINRFCKKIGYKGFNAFKVALAQENFYNQMKEQPAAGAPNSLVASVSRDYQQMLVNTSAMLDESMLLAAAERLKAARCTYIFAVSNTAFVAHELEFKLNMVGLPCRAVTNVLDMRVHASNMQQGDLAIFIAPTVLMRDVYQAVTASKDRGAYILTITSYDSPKIADLVDFKFVTSDKIITQNSVSISNNLTFLFASDVLYCALLDGDRTLRQKKLSSDALVNNQQMIMDNYMFEY